MKKVAYVFVLAVFLPSLVLAWLAIRSLRDQQFVIERQQSLLYQGVADHFARNAKDYLDEQQKKFGDQVEDLLRHHEPSHLIAVFDDALRTNWPLAEVGFVVTAQGTLLCPPRADAEKFCEMNRAFLGSREVAEVYWNAKNPANDEAGKMENLPLAQTKNSAPSTDESYTDGASKNVSQAKGWFNSRSPQQRSIVPQQAQMLNPPTQIPADLNNNFSKVTPSEAAFNQLVRESSEGTVARFLDDRLTVLIWYRPRIQTNYVFGAQVSLAALNDEMKRLLRPLDIALRREICVAVLNDKARPVATTYPKFQAKNWKRPFVATEIGEALPHWEVAVYLLNPAQLAHSARKVTVFLAIVIAILVIEVCMGSAQIFKDLKRQEILARQKTDFVSNVSHELKTPLTSIRMFSEMLAEGRVADPQKQRSYLNIITAEAARLTRLINNVLDFSRMERGEKKYNFQTFNLVDAVREIVETYRPHLESNGFQINFTFPQRPISIFGDRDALAQVVVNLLSNAEKYSDGAKKISVEVESDNNMAEVKVKDRGSGVPKGSEEKIFEQFYRAHDSLSSGIQGSGLGLTLARQIARAHDGDVMFQRREGGGSCFTLRVPMKSEV